MGLQGVRSTVVGGLLGVGALAVGMSLEAPAWGAEGSAATPRRVVLLVTSGLSGALAAHQNGATVADVAATVQQRAVAARAAGAQVVVLDAGRTLTPSAESHVDRGAAMLRVLAAAGCQVYLPDPMDLSAAGPYLAELFAGGPFPALRPLGSTGGHVAADLPAEHLVDLGGGLRLHVVSIFDPGFAGDLGASLPADPGEVLRQMPPGDALRLAVVHSRGHGDALMSRGLTWDLLERGDGPLVFLDPDLGHDMTLRREGSRGPMFLVGRKREPGQAWTVAQVTLDLALHQGGWQPAAAVLEVVPVDGAAPPIPGLEAAMQAAIARFRQVHGAPLPPHAPTRWEELSTFVLQAARERARAEVAILNRGAIRTFPADHDGRGLLREESVVRMLPLDQTLVVVEVPGRELLALVRDSVRRVRSDGLPRMDSLVWTGMEVAVDNAGTPEARVRSLRVNGRPLEPNDTYSVVINGFLHAGGAGYQALTGDESVLRDDQGAALELRDDVVLPRLREAARPFADLARRPLWRFGADRLRLSFDGIRTDHDPAYRDVADSRARAEDSSSFLAEALVRADQDRYPYRWENRLRARFGLLDTEGVRTREIDDHLLAESSLLLAVSPGLAGGRPFGSLSFDTEFRPNRDGVGDRLPRRQEWTLAAGVTWSFSRFPRLRLGVVTREFGGLDRARQTGVVAEGTFSRKPAGHWPGMDVRLLLEDLRGSGETVRRADLEVQVQYPLRKALMFTPAVNYYIYDDSALPGSSRYLRMSVGFGYSWGGKVQRL